MENFEQPIDPRLCTGELSPFIPHYTRINNISYSHTAPSPSPARSGEFVLPSHSQHQYSPSESLTQTIGLYNILFVNEVIDFLAADLGQLLVCRSVMRHKVAMHYNRFRSWRSKYDKLIHDYLRRHNILFDAFCDASDRFFELTTSKSPNFTRLHFSISNAYHKADTSPSGDANHDIMVRLCILGHSFSIAMQNFADWTAWFVTNCPERFSDISPLNITDWTQLYNNILPHLCLSLGLHEIDLDIHNIRTGASIYAQDLMSVQLTFEALGYLGRSEHSVSDLGVIRPPHFDVPERYNIKKPVIILRS